MRPSRVRKYFAAHQCRTCQHINYENLDAFLCIDCGHCRFAKMSVSVRARASPEVDRIQNEADEAACLRRIEDEVATARVAAHKLEQLGERVARATAVTLPTVPEATTAVTVDAGVGQHDSAADAGTPRLPKALLAQDKLYQGSVRETSNALSHAAAALASARREVRIQWQGRGQAWPHASTGRMLEAHLSGSPATDPTLPSPMRASAAGVRSGAAA